MKNEFNSRFSFVNWKTKKEFVFRSQISKRKRKRRYIHGPTEWSIQYNSHLYEADDIMTGFGLTDEEKRDYDVVKTKFDAHFGFRRNAIFERAKFNRRSQEEGESVDSFVTSLYCLAEHCEYGILKEEMIRDRIVEGITDTSLSLKLQMDGALTVKQAIDMARQNEAVKGNKPF